MTPPSTRGVQTLTIPARMPGLNELIGAALTHRGSYGTIKKKWGRTIGLLAYAQGFKRLEAPAHFEFEFGETTRRRDPDGLVGGALKVFFDGLQEAGLLVNDNWEWVLSFVATWKVSEKAYVKVTVRT